MSSVTERQKELAPQIQSRLQALQLLVNAVNTVNDCASGVELLPNVDGGSKAAIDDGLQQLLDYMDRVRAELGPDPLSQLDQMRVATAVAQAEDWLRFVTAEVKQAGGGDFWGQSFLNEFEGTVKDVLKSTGAVIGSGIASALSTIPWYVYAGVGVVALAAIIWKVK